MAFVINELLCFLSTQFDKLDRKNITSILSEFYSLTEAVNAKEILVEECELLQISNDISQFKKPRKNGNESAISKIIKDIIDIWVVIDTTKTGVTSRQFVAGDPNRLPQVNAEKYNLKFLISAILCLQEQVSTISNVVTRVDKRVELSSLNASMLNVSIPSFSPAPPVRTLPFTPPAISPEDVLFPELILPARKRFNSSAQPFVPEKYRKTSASTYVVSTPELGPDLVLTSVGPPTSSSTSSASAPVTISGAAPALVSPSVSPLLPPALVVDPKEASTTSATSAPTVRSAPALVAASTVTPEPEANLILQRKVSAAKKSVAAKKAALKKAEIAAKAAVDAAAAAEAPAVETPAAAAGATSAAAAAAGATVAAAPEVGTAAAAASAAEAAAALIPSFSDTATLLRSNNNDWIVYQRKNRKIVPVTGSGESSVLEGVAKPKRNFWELSLSRLKIGSSSDCIKAHLHSKNIEVKDVFVFPSKIKGTVSAKVRVALEHKDRALDAANWPPHLRISSWTNKSKTARNNDAANQQVALEL